MRRAARGGSNECCLLEPIINNCSDSASSVKATLCDLLILKWLARLGEPWVTMRCYAGVARG